MSLRFPYQYQIGFEEVLVVCHYTLYVWLCTGLCMMNAEQLESSPFSFLLFLLSDSAASCFNF